MMHYETSEIRLLLVESQAQLRERFKTYLLDAGLNIVLFEAQTGEQAIEMYQNNTYNMVFTNNDLSDMNAQIVLAYLQDGPTLTTSVIVYSDSEQPNLDLELLESGALDFIPLQHCNPPLLRQAILHALVRRRYIHSQQEYLLSQKQLLEQQTLYEEEKKMTLLKMEKEHAEQANRAKSQFLSNMSHELRTPLNAILGFAQLLMFKSKANLSQTQSDNIREIIHAGEHLLALINDVLDLSKIEAGKLEFHLADVAVQPMLEECKVLTSELAQSKGCEVTLHCEAGLKVKADYTRLKQVVLNLLSNAIKYNKQQGSVDIHCHKQGDFRVRILVKDTGIGIDRQHFDEVFKPFNRLTAVDSSVEGTGIGLTLSRKLALEMCGDIEFESELGVGSRFWVDMPLFCAESQPDVKEQLLLYLDGSEENIAELKQLCGRIEGLRVESAATVSDAITMSMARQPNIIIIDIDRVDTSMVKVIELLSRQQALTDVQTIALGSEVSRDEISDALGAGYDQVLTKPMSMNDLVQLVESLVSNVRIQQQLQPGMG